MKNVVGGGGGSDPRVIGERFLRKRFFFREPPGRHDPNESLLVVILLLLAVAIYTLLTGQHRPAHFFFFGWGYVFGEWVYRALNPGPLTNDITPVTFILSAVLAGPLAYYATKWVRKSAPHYIVVIMAASNVVVFTAALGGFWEFLEPTVRAGKSSAPFMPTVDRFIYPLFVLLAVWETRSSWPSFWKPLDLAQLSRTERTTRSFDGSAESIEALRRFASGSAPAASATVGGTPPDIRGLDPQGVAELIARTNAGERYEDVAASLLARGAARPVETEGPPSKHAPLSSGKLADFDDL